MRGVLVLAQTQYLTDKEIEEYCEQIPATKTQVLFASAIIDAYVGLYNGRSKFSTSEYTETVTLNRKGIAKLSRSPIVNIVNIKADGGLMIPSFNVDLKLFEVEDSGYIHYIPFGIMRRTISNPLAYPIKRLQVTYTYGYDEIPEQVKRACAMIAMNISQTATFTSLQSMTTLDARFALSDPSVITPDIKFLLSRYR